MIKVLLYENSIFVLPLKVLSYSFCCYKHYSVGEIMSQSTLLEVVSNQTTPNRLYLEMELV